MYASQSVSVNVGDDGVDVPSVVCVREHVEKQR